MGVKPVPWRAKSLQIFCPTKSFTRRIHWLIPPLWLRARCSIKSAAVLFLEQCSPRPIKEFNAYNQWNPPWWWSLADSVKAVFCCSDTEGWLAAMFYKLSRGKWPSKSQCTELYESAYTSLREAVVCGRMVFSACCDKHTGKRHISLSPEPLLTVLAFRDSWDDQRQFKIDLWHFGQRTFIVYCTTRWMFAKETASLCDRHYQHIYSLWSAQQLSISLTIQPSSSYIKVALS